MQLRRKIFASETSRTHLGNIMAREWTQVVASSNDDAGPTGRPGGPRLGDDELLLVTTADNQSVLPMALGSGLRGGIRMSGDVLGVRVPLRDLETTRP